MIFGRIFIGTLLFVKRECLSSGKVRLAHPPEAENDGKMEYWARSEALALYWVFCTALKNIMIYEMNASWIEKRLTESLKSSDLARCRCSFCFGL